MIKRLKLGFMEFDDLILDSGNVVNNNIGLKFLLLAVIRKYNEGESLIQNETPFGNLEICFIGIEEVKQAKPYLPKRFREKVSITCNSADVSVFFYIQRFGHDLLIFNFENASFASVFITRKLLLPQLDWIYLLENDTVVNFVGMIGVFCKFKNENPNLYRTQHKQITH